MLNSTGLNQYGSVGNANYSYDNNGNVNDINDGQFQYVYDCENRLIDVNENGSPVASYAYDYLGRRISKTVDGNTTKYCYDGGQVIAEYENGDLARKFIYGPGIDEPIMMIEVDDETETKYYYHFDGLGSVVALSDTSANVVERYSYDVFGEPTIYDADSNEISDSNYDNPYMFTARRYDPEAGLYYYRARFYAYDIGRFLQTDPLAPIFQFVYINRSRNENFLLNYLSSNAINELILTDPILLFLTKEPNFRLLQATHSGFFFDSHLYRYCGNNPLIYFDPYGLGWFSDFVDWVWEVIKCVFNIPDPRDMKDLHDNCKKGIRENMERHNRDCNDLQDDDFDLYPPFKDRGKKVPGK